MVKLSRALDSECRVCYTLNRIDCGTDWASKPYLIPSDRKEKAMSVNVYLKNEVRERLGFSSVPSDGGSGNEITFNGRPLREERERRIYLVWNEDDPIPDDLKDLVEEVSRYEWVPRMGVREPGIYRLNTAECRMIPDDMGSARRPDLVYKLRLRAKNLEDVNELMHRIMVGTIRPEESYEGNQQGKSRQQLEGELVLAQVGLSEAQHRIKTLQRVLEITETSLQNMVEKHALLSKLVRTLEKRFPLVLSSRIARRIEEILVGATASK